MARNDTTPPKRLWLVIFACLQTMCCAGIIFGWASVAGTLLIAPLEEGGANLTMDETTIIFSLAASTASFSSLFLGYVLDTRGPRVCSLTAHLFIGAGCMIFTFSSHYHGFLWGACLIAFGGPGIQAANVHLANLFPDQKFTVMSSIMGSVTLSFAILPIFDVLWETYGIGIRSMFGSYVGIVCLSTLGSHCFWPDTPFELDEESEKLKANNGDDETDACYDPTPEETFLGAVSRTHLVEAPLSCYLRSNSHQQMSSHASFHQSVNAMVSGNYKVLSIKDQPFLSQLLSGAYIRIVILFVATSFMANFYIASLPTELADLDAYSSEAQHKMARSFTLMTSIGIVASFMIGWLMDQIGLETCTILTLLMGQLHMVILIFCTGMPIPMLVGFFVYTLFRQFLFPVFIACLSARLGFKYYGILSGLGFSASGMAQIFIASLVMTVQGDCHLEMVDGCSHGYWKELHIVQLCILSALWLVPVVAIFMRKSKRTSPTKWNATTADYGSLQQEPRGQEGEYDGGILI